MSKLFSLLKAIMSGGIQIFDYHVQNERSKRSVPILLAIFMGIIMLFSTVALITELKHDGTEFAVLSLYTLATVIIIVTEGVYKFEDLLFKPRDNDNLLAMPIKKSTIVLARMIKFYAFEMLYCLIFLLPAIIAYMINVEVEIEFYLVAITMLILVPIIPITISCIVGLIISAISARSKHKSLLQIILSLIALFMTVLLIVYLNTTSDSDGQSIIAVSNRITNYYYPASVFVNLAIHFDLGEYLIFIGVNLIVLGATAFLISRFYFQIITKLNIINYTKDYHVKYNFIKHGQVFAVVKKEINKYFNTPVLLANTALGLLLFLVTIGLLCFNFDDIVISIISSVEDFPLTADDLYSYLPSVTFVLVAFASLMTFITATMISLEGKSFDSLKSMPISGRRVIISKVLAAMLLITPVTALGSFIMIIRFGFDIVDSILVLFGVVVIPLVTELIGIMINLKYARFDADNDAVIVRQSASVLIATFLGLALVFVTIPLTFVAVIFAGQMEGLLMMDAFFMIVSSYLYFAIAMRGEENYMKLSV